MLVELETQDEALSCFEVLKNDLLRREGAPKLGTEDLGRDLPDAAKIMRELVGSNSTKYFYWENEVRFLALDLSRADEEWQVSEILVAPIGDK